MKAFRWFFYTTMALCLLGGLINGIRAYYLVFFLQLFVLITSFALNVWTAFSFAYLQTTDEKRAVKGDSFMLHLGIYNDKPFPFTMMRLHISAVSDDDKIDVSFNLMPNSKIDFDLPLALPYRGEFRVGMTYLEITDIFGLCHMKFDMRKLAYYRQKELAIYPRLVILPKLQAVAGDTKHFNALNIKAANEGDSFAGARLYQRGDPSKRVHWKMSFKQRELYAKQFDIPMESRSVIFINSTPKAQRKENLLYADTACECATAIAYHFLSSEHPVKIVETSDRMLSVASRTIGGFQSMYDWLAHLPFNTKGSVEAAVMAELKTGRDIQAIYIITPNMDQEIVKTAKNALAQNCLVTCITVDKDENIDQQKPPKAARIISVRSGENLAEILGGAI